MGTGGVLGGWHRLSKRGSRVVGRSWSFRWLSRGVDDGVSCLEGGGGGA